MEALAALVQVPFLIFLVKQRISAQPIAYPQKSSFSRTSSLMSTCIKVSHGHMALLKCQLIQAAILRKEGELPKWRKSRTKRAKSMCTIDRTGRKESESA